MRESLRSPLPRAAVETFLDVFSTPALTWDDLAKAREWTTLPIILKGIVHPDDAARALDAGVDGVVGLEPRRPPDRPVGADARGAARIVVERVGGRVPVVLRLGRAAGGGRRSSPSRWAPRRSAIGRPYAYGLAVAGEAGVREVIRNILAELDITLGLAGCTSIAELGPERAPSSLTVRARSVVRSRAATGRTLYPWALAARRRATLATAS